MNSGTKTMDHIETEARIAKLIAETAKINQETKYYSVFVAAALMGAGAALAKIFMG